jgi:Family of unknown function (DUF6477)
MPDFRALLADLRRPQLLIRAARFGLVDYRRDRDLRRLIQREVPPARALTQLLEVEAQIEETRKAGDAAYSVNRHVDVLIALLGEARLLPRGEVVAF